VRGRLVLFLSDDHPLIPRTALEAVNGVRGRAHSGSDGGGGKRLRPGRSRGISGRPCTTAGVESGGMRGARGGSGGRFGLVLACGALSERRPVGGGEVQCGTEVTIFLLQLCDALLEGLQSEASK
jgi:hypothetical protein